MAYVWAAIILVGLFFIFGIVRNWRLHKSEGERTKRTEIRQENRTKRWEKWRRRK